MKSKREIKKVLYAEYSAYGQPFEGLFPEFKSSGAFKHDIYSNCRTAVFRRVGMLPIIKPKNN